MIHFSAKKHLCVSKDFARNHPDAADPLMRWAEFVEKTELKNWDKQTTRFYMPR